MSQENKKPEASQENDRFGLSQYDAELEERFDNSFKEENGLSESEDEQNDEDTEAEETDESEEGDEGKSNKTEDESGDSELESLKKQYKDTRDWASKTNQTAIERTKVISKMVTKLREKGNTDEDIAELMGIPVEQVSKVMDSQEFRIAAADDPYTYKVTVFDQQLQNLINLGMLDTLLPEGEELKPYLDALGAVMHADPELREEFLKAENPVKFGFSKKVIEAVKDLRSEKDLMSSPLKTVKKLKAESAAKDKRIAELEAQLAGEETDADENQSSQTNKKMRPKLGGSSTTERVEKTHDDEDLFPHRNRR